MCTWGFVCVCVTRASSPKRRCYKGVYVSCVMRLPRCVMTAKPTSLLVLYVDAAANRLTRTTRTVTQAECPFHSAARRPRILARTIHGSINFGFFLSACKQPQDAPSPDHGPDADITRSKSNRYAFARLRLLSHSHAQQCRNTFCAFTMVTREQSLAVYSPLHVPTLLSRPRRERCVLPDGAVVDGSSQHNLMRPVSGGRVLPCDADHDEARVRREEEFVLGAVVGVVRVEGATATGNRGG